jgi:hypothetical protein
MRSYSHWTPAYIFHRLADWYYRARNPEAPWLTPKAVEYLNNALQPEFNGLEYGSGRSTIWFAKRVKKLVSVEHNPDWFRRIQEEMKMKGIDNIEYHHFIKPDSSSSLMDNLKSDYVQATSTIAESSLDFVLVDGVVRPACMIHAIPLLRNGGLLILDDANHYLPCDSGAPNTRSQEDGPLNDGWKQVQQQITDWQAIWFGNGIKETVLFRKPEN